MIRVELTEKECGAVAAFFDAKSKDIAAKLCEAVPSELGVLTRELTELARLAGKFEAARSLARGSSSAPVLVVNDAALPDVFLEDTRVYPTGGAMDAGVTRHVKK